MLIRARCLVTDVKRTYEYIEPGAKDHITWSSQPGSVLDKRQCSLQVTFRLEGKQPHLAIIFRGTGKRIRLDQKLLDTLMLTVYSKKMPE